MPPLPSSSLAEETAHAPSARQAPRQAPEQLRDMVLRFLEIHPGACALEDGKVVFELAEARHEVAAEHGRCTLHLWSSERNLVRTVASAEERTGALRLNTVRFGHSQTKMMELRAAAQPRNPARREPARQRYLRLLERVLVRAFPDWKAEGFRAAMDLERSFGPAYVRGTLGRGNEAWAVIGVSAAESQATIDGVLSLGILWLHHCRERGDGRRLYKGLRVVVPRGAALVTHARLPWMSPAAGRWELYELGEDTEELTQRDPEDQGNVRTRLIHLPDEVAAQERFAGAITQVRELLPPGQEHRVQQRLRSTAELAFLLHGLEFARARISLAPGRFSQTIEVVVGGGGRQTLLTPASREEIREHVTELFERRHFVPSPGHPARPALPSGRTIGAETGRPAHARLGLGGDGSRFHRLESRNRVRAAQNDPLYRAAPERWLESVLRENLAPLSRSLAPTPMPPGLPRSDRFANELDPDARGNRLPDDPPALPHSRRYHAPPAGEGIIPRFDPRFVYTQVPAIAGAGDRGMLDLLGVTADGRLAVLELKTADDLQMPLQGLDYWIRIRHHHRQTDTAAAGSPAGGNDLQRHGYFREIELSPLPPRLFLVAPALHIHPATETILRYLSPNVEWTLLALDERWRQEVRVVWRRSGGHAPQGFG